MAEAAQDEKEAAPHAVEASLVSVDPPALLHAGTGDLATNGPCEAELDAACSDVRPGEGRLAECLIGALVDGGASGSPLTASPPCRAELLAFASERADNVNADVPLADACAGDLEAFCADVEDEFSLLGCLREAKDDLTPACATVVSQRQADAAAVWSADAELAAACEGDVAELCSDAGDAPGAVGACLRVKPGRLTWECRDEVFRQDVENADDLRLNGGLFRTCLPDKRAFCASVPPGHGAAQACLEAARHKPGFTPACRDALDALLARRAADFRLDPGLRAACAADADVLCGLELDESDDAGADVDDAPVLTCLQDYRDELKSPDCAAAVHASLARAAADIRFDAPLAAACAGDRARACGHVPPGSAAVLRCLQDARGTLTPECAASLFDAEVRMSESIDFQASVATACRGELRTLCADVPHTRAAALRCLQDAVLDSRPGVTTDCTTAVEAHMRASARDFRLNARLSAACQPTAATLCAGACAPPGGPPFPDDVPCGGTVLRCLADRVEGIHDDACRREVEYFVRMEVHDFRNDILLAEACRADVDAFCGGVAPGGVVACLAEHRGALSAACASAVADLERVATASVDLQPALASACSAERKAHCDGVPAGKARVLACLVAAADGADFGEACVEAVRSAVSARGREWKADGGLRAACAADAASHCAGVKGRGGAMHACLAAKGASALAPACAAALARSVRGGLQFWAPGAPITTACDADVAARCDDAARARVGGVRACLVAAVPSADDEAAVEAAAEEGDPTRRRLAADAAAASTSSSLSPSCAALVAIAEPRASYGAFESSLALGALAAGAARLESRLGLAPGTQTPPHAARAAAASRGAAAGAVATLTLTGWGAVAGVAALTLVAIVAVGAAYARHKGFHKGYTRVVKARRRLPTHAPRVEARASSSDG